MDFFTFLSLNLLFLILNATALASSGLGVIQYSSGQVGTKYWVSQAGWLSIGMLSWVSLVDKQFSHIYIHSKHYGNQYTLET